MQECFRFVACSQVNSKVVFGKTHLWKLKRRGTANKGLHSSSLTHWRMKRLRRKCFRKEFFNQNLANMDKMWKVSCFHG